MIFVQNKDGFMNSKIIFNIFILLVLISTLPVEALEKVVYGDDNRLDLFEVSNPLYLDLARSTAAKVDSSNLSRESNGDYAVHGPTLEKSMRACPNSRFAQQLTVAQCTGFLVAPNILVTAGHCATGQNDCSNFKWIFDYGIHQKSRFGELNLVPRERVYNCKKIISQIMENTVDFAVIQLDRPVFDRQPLIFRKSGMIKDDTELVIIGHPLGLPMKVAGDAFVRSNADNAFFVANLDSFGGNSGSPVFDANTGIVEGILVRGEQDMDYDSQNQCYIPKVCSNAGCRGEDVIRITNVKAIYSPINEDND